MSNIQTLAANMRNAFVERKGATIGGGEFTPEELRDGAIALKAFPEVLAALRLLHEHMRAYSAEYRNGLGDTDALYTQVRAALEFARTVE